MCKEPFLLAYNQFSTIGTTSDLLALCNALVNSSMFCFDNLELLVALLSRHVHNILNAPR